MERCSDCVSAGPLGFGIGNEASILGGVMEAFEGCISEFETRWVGRLAAAIVGVAGMPSPGVVITEGTVYDWDGSDGGIGFRETYPGGAFLCMWCSISHAWRRLSGRLRCMRSCRPGGEGARMPVPREVEFEPSLWVVRVVLRRRRMV